MTISRNSGSSSNSSKNITIPTSKNAKRLAYISLIPVLSIILLIAMFGLMGALPGLVDAQASIMYAIPDGSGSICDASNPCSLQTAVNQVLAGGEVRAASGTYTSTTPISVTQSITITGGYIYSGGGIWSSEATLYNITTLNGESSHRVLEIAADVSPTISNFHIENGAASNGAGIFIAPGNGLATINTNVIRNNDETGGKGGGGIYDGGASIIENNEIYNNTTTGGSGGGGILVDNSTATISSTIRFNDIYNNQAIGSSSFGGGVFLDVNADALLVANTINDNTGRVGGGIGTSVNTNIAMISNMVYDNTANSGTVPFGGGLSTAGQAVIWSNTFVGNNAANGGGGIFLDGATAEISNNIVAFNTGGGSDGIDYAGSSPGLITGGYNNIFDDTTHAQISLTNPVAGDPDFVNLAGRNLHINETSPARNAGDPSTPAWVDIDIVDIDRQIRPNPIDNLHDVGADEYYPNFAAFDLLPPVTNNFVERGNTEVFTHTIENNGTVDDRYNIECSSDIFTVTICSSPTVTVPAGSAAQIATSVEIPANLIPYQVGETTITATSQVSSALFARATVRSTVAPHPGLSFTPNYSRTELPGDVITLTHTLSNTGDADGNFIVTEIVDTYGWGELLPSDPYIISIPSGGNRNVQVRITIPEFAPQGLANLVQLKASSQFDSDISDTVVNTITAKATTGIRYVRFGGSDTNNNCTQSSDPCGSIKHAVGQAASGDEVRIGPGTFLQENNINVNDTIFISGGWNNFGSDGQGDEPDPSLTKIDAGGSGPVFVIGAGNPSISVLTMQNGQNLNGGAVFVNSGTTPNFFKVVFDNNLATNNGGALFVNGGTAVTVRKGLFTNNSTTNGNGGAVYMSGGTLSLNQSQFITNTAGSSGGALTLNSGLLTAQNNLFHNSNAAGSGGAVRLNNGTANFNFNTFVENSATGNGGGVYNDGATATINNSIFADNTAANGSAVFENSGSTTLDYLNLWNNDANVATGSNSIFTDPLFADEEFRLADGSQAIDAASPTIDIDFEDDARPTDEGHDIGYDERAGCRTQRADEIYGSIQAAVDVENDDILIKVSGICRGVHTIDVGSGPISQTVHLTKSVIIQGGWDGEFSERFVDPTRVDPEGRGRGFYITNGVSVTIEGLTVTNGSAVGLGGGPADEDAGGVFYNVDGDVTLKGVSIFTGTAELGGGFYNDSGAPILTWLVQETNDEDIYYLTEIADSSAGSGGGVYNDSGSMMLDGTWLHNNQATDNGGGLLNQTGSMMVVNTILDSNTADLGAGLYNEAPASDYLHMTLYNNTATTNGGGFYNAAGQPTLSSNIFESNQAASGSAVYDAANAAVDYNYYYLNNGTAVFGTVTGTNSIETDTMPPGLIDPAAGDFHLFDEAAASDVGDPDSPVSSDFEDDPRPSNQGFDMGADEIVGCLVQLNDEIYGSLQAAIDDAQPGDEIKVSGTCSGVHPYDPGVINACGGAMQTAVHIDKDIIITGGWDEEFRTQEEGEYSTLDAKGLGRVIYIGQGVSTTIQSFAMINGVATNGAGICIDNAQPTLQNNRIYSNTAANDGGGIYSLDSTPLIERGNHIYLNEALDGGGLYLTGSGSVTATIKNNFIYWNITADEGAGIYSANGNHATWHNTLYGNIASGNGGAYYVASNTPDIRGSILMANEANSGGALYANTALTTDTVDFNDYYENLPGNFGGSFSNNGSNSVSVDPQFYNVISGVFTITINSPVVDFNIPNMPVFEDYEGDLRPSHQGYDLGADEVGGCFATILQDPDGIVYGSVQKAVDMASDDNTVLVDGICQGVNTRQVGGVSVSQALVLTKSLTIDGSWDHPDDTSDITTTIDALDEGRVVYVDNGITVSITNIIMRQGDANGAGNGNNGGGVFNEGFLTINNAWIQENTAVSGGGIYNEGTLTVEQSYILTNTAAQDGGGLYSNTTDGILTTVAENHIRNNMMGDNGDGGGIYHQAGALLVKSNRISRNGYNSSPGGNGGGLYLNSGTTASVDIRNNFIYDNWANEGGGLFNANTNGRLWHNTFYGNIAINNNGGGIASINGSPDIRNNIVDTNNGHGIYTTNGSPLIDYNNAVNNTLDNILTDVSIGSNNISALPSYISLPEQDFHLFQGSRGEDEGDPDVSDDSNPNYVDDDIDGDLRPTNGGPDIGADEINSCLVKVGDQIFSVLQDAIDYAYTSNETDVLIARGECRGAKYNPTSGTWQVGYITNTLNFIGSLRRLDFADLGDYFNPEIGRLTTIINGADEGRAIYIANGAEPTFKQIAFVGGSGTAGGGNNHGGGIYKDGVGDVFLGTVHICENTAQDGAGLYAAAASSSIDVSGSRIGYCWVKQLTEDDEGQVIDQRNVYFDENMATGNGGGVYTNGQLEFWNTSVYGNSANSNGGGVFNGGSLSNLVNITFYENSALGDGGGLFVNSTASNVNVWHNTIRDNYAGGNGGGIRSLGSSLDINSSIIYTNTSIAGDGGLSASSANLNYNNFWDNTPTDYTSGLSNNNPRNHEPGLLGIRLLSVDSQNIDSADPTLLPTVFEDFQGELRPDGSSGLLPPNGLYADVGADEYYKDFGCKIEPTSATQSAAPGDIITYTLSIINTGNPPYTDLQEYEYPNGYTDTITVTITSSSEGWAELEGGDPQEILLGWDDWSFGEWATRVLTVTVPINAQVGRGETTVLECRSSAKPSQFKTATINTNVGLAGGVLVVPDEVGTAVPGDVITYEQTIINQQNQEATYLLTPSSGPQHANAVLLESLTLSPTANITVTLAPSNTVGYTTTALLEVTILDTATAGDEANPGLVAQDVTDDNIQNASLHRITILAAPGTRYVADIGADNTNCTDPLQPCATIQHAIEQAVNGDEIRVAAGTYTDYTTKTVGSDTLQQNLFIDKSLTIAGGYSAVGNDPFTVQEPITNVVRLDGENSRRVIYIADGITVTLNGLIVDDGHTETAWGMNGSTGDYGAGIYNAGANLIVHSTWIQSNTSLYGAGLYHAGGDLLFYSNVVAYNKSPDNKDGEGGGLYIASGESTIENNTFSANNVDPIGSRPGLNADSAAETGFGGAIFLDAASAAVTNNIFYNNVAIQGLALYISNTASITNDFNLYYDFNPATQESDFINGGNWGINHLEAEPQFVSPLDFHILSTSPAKDTGTPSVTISQSVDLDIEPRIMGPGIDIGADERTQRPGFLFEPEILSATIDSGTVITYKHQITNTGDFTDSYSLSLANQIIPAGDGSWGYSYSPQTINDLAPMDSVTVTLVVTGGQPGYVMISTITADSLSGLSRSVTDTTTISQTAGVDIEQSSAQIGLPGELITYSHTLTNTGNGIDQFDLTATAVPTDWVVSLVPTQTGFLAPLETMPFTVTVLIPVNAISGTQHVVTVTAVATDPDASDTLTDTTTVGLVSSLTLVPDHTRSVPDGTSTIYTHTLTSGSNITDVVSLAVTGSLPAWVTAIEPTSVTLNPYESRIVSVTVTVPPDTGGLTHVANVTATSTLPGITASATDTTTVPVETAVLFTPNYTRVVNADTTEIYTHTLTNMGNATDTFTLTQTTTQGWLESITPSPVVVGPGASVQVTAVVSVPFGTLPATEDILVITATSQAVPTTTGSVTDTTRVIQNHDLAFYPDRSDTVDAGTTKVYTHTLENLGDGVDTFDLTYSGIPAWSLTLPPTPITLDPLASTTVVVTLTVPTGASGLTNITHITATSTISNIHAAMVTDTTTVSGTIATLGVDIEANNLGIGALNETLTYVHTVTNTGSGPDDIGLSVVSGWAATIEPDQVTLASGASALVTVTVTIPGTATPGEEDLAQVTAVSLSDPSVSDMVTDTTRLVQNHGLMFFPDRAQTVNAGSTAVYTHTLRNTGDGPDTFAIIPNSSHGWSAAVVSPVTLAANEETSVVVTLTVPAGTEGQVDIMPVTASSVISPAFSAMVTDTTTVAGTAPTSDVQIEPDHTGYGISGDTIQYVHIVTNTGTAADTFDITTVSSLRWTPSVQPLSLNLAAGESGLVTVTITIPAGSGVGTTDVTTVTVTSQTDAAITDSAVDTTIVPGVFLPIILKPDDTIVPPTPTPPPGPTDTPTPTATPPSCTTPTGIDLVVTEIRVEPPSPIAGEPALVHVTIRNQGFIDVAPSNNFYLDFYVDRVPARYLIGDIEWGVQGEWMQAGENHTLSGSFTFSGGPHQLWAQVDTDNTVDECPFEDNNLLGTDISVSGTSNAAGQENPTRQTQPNNGPRQTPTPAINAVVPDENILPVMTEQPLSTQTSAPPLTVTPPPPG